MPRSPYPSDLTDEQWAILAPLLPPAPRNCRPRQAVTLTGPAALSVTYARFQGSGLIHFVKPRQFC